MTDEIAARRDEDQFWRSLNLGLAPNGTNLSLFPALFSGILRGAFWSALA